MFFYRTNQQPTSGPLGPKPAGHPSVGAVCVACGVRLREGDVTTLVPLGPGDDEEAQEKCRAGRFYNAVAVEVHWTCAGGIDLTDT
jgi:hypothetical protein